MIVESREHTYEAIRKLDMGEKLEHYVCRRDGEPEETLKHLVRNRDPETFPAFLSALAPLEENPAFTDLEEIIPEGGELWLVFPCPKGPSLADFLEDVPALKERFEVGRSLLETLILHMVPEEIMWDILDSRRIAIDPAGPSVEGFLYSLEDAADFPSISTEEVFLRLGGVLAELFASETESGRYPGTKDFLQSVSGGVYADIMECYQEYMMLLPAMSEEKTAEKKEKKQRFTRLKKLAGHKKLLAALVLLLLAFLTAAMAGPLVWREVLYPHIEEAYLVKTMEVDGPEAAGYTGRVVLTDPDTGKTVFTGRLSEGRKEGKGRLFYPEGNALYYDGYFQGDRYEGEGVLYYENGEARYEGGFAKGRASGGGTLYDRDGNLLYEGGFSEDLYEGDGRLYEDGKLVYEGGFHRGVFDGKGTAYQEGLAVETGTYGNGNLKEGTVIKQDKNGRVSYRGGWDESGRSGDGTAYENGARIYQGIFKNNRYDGEGKLYSPNTGDLIYEGGFVEGDYSGTGKLYEPGRNYMIYEGGFRLGVYDGEGKEYDEDGNLRYEGRFQLGLYHGSGIFYDGDTGRILEEGEFRNGLLVTPRELLETEEAPEEVSGEEAPEEEATEEATEEVPEEEVPEEEASAARARESPAVPSDPPSVYEKETQPEIGPGIFQTGQEKEEAE